MSKQIKLSQESFNIAAKFIQNNASPMHNARFEFHFGEGISDLVVEELWHF